MEGVATNVVVPVAPGAIVSTELLRLVDTSLVSDPSKRAFEVIVKDGKFFKNRLSH